MKMKKIIIISITILIAISSLYAKKKAKTKVAEYNPLLYEAINPTTNKKVILFGTIHLSNKELVNLPDSLYYYLIKTQTFANEVNMDIMQNEEMSFKLMKYIRIEGDTTLLDLFTSSEQTILDSLLIEKTGYGIAMFSTFKPIFLYGLLLKGEEKKDTNSYPILDVYLYQVAKKNKVQIVGLEEVESQLILLNDVPLRMQADLIKEFLNPKKGDDKKSNAVNDMLRLYLAGDTSKMAVMIKNQDDLFAGFEDKFLNKRNIVMVDKIHQISSTNELFVAIGAAHLGGKYGVLNLLAQKGYRIRKIGYKERISFQEAKKIYKID
jgi:uncharacterized protein YbaP (TraB family)